MLKIWIFSLSWWFEAGTG